MKAEAEKLREKSVRTSDVTSFYGQATSQLISPDSLIEFLLSCSVSSVKIPFGRRG